MKPGDVCRCISSFTGVLPEELTLYKNDVVQVQTVVDRHWVEAEGVGGVGKVPSSVLVTTDLPPHPPNLPLFVALAEFMPSQPEDLGFCRGDFIIGLNPVDESWWCGEVYGKKGIFPLNFVWRVNKDIMQVEDKSEKPVSLRGRVKTSLRAQLDEELNLYAGDIVNITHVVDKDWFRGESNGSHGIFPRDFVDIVEEEEEEVVVFPQSVPPTATHTTAGPEGYGAPTPTAHPPAATHHSSSVTPTSSLASSFPPSNVTASQPPTSPQPASQYTTAPVPLFKTSAHWKTIEDSTDDDIFDDDYFKTNMPGMYCSPGAATGRRDDSFVPHSGPPHLPATQQHSASYPYASVQDVPVPPVAPVSLPLVHPSQPTTQVCNEPVSLSNTSSAWKTVEAGDEGNIFDDDYFKQNMPSYYQSGVPEPVSSSNTPSSSSCTTSSFPHSAFTTTHCYQDTTPEASTPAPTNGSITAGSRYQNIIETESPGTINAPVDTSAFSTVQETGGVGRLNSLSVKVDNYLSSLSSNAKLTNNNNVLNQDYTFVSSSGYNEDNTGIEPYGRAVFSFKAQYQNELTFKKGDIVHLIKHIDSHWTLGCVGGATGIFPTSYVDIIVNCLHDQEQAFLSRSEADLMSGLMSPHLSHAKAEFDFQGVESGDITMKKGDNLKVLKYIDNNWLIVEDMSGNKGMCPKNYVTIVNKEGTDADDDGVEPVPEPSDSEQNGRGQEGRSRLSIKEEVHTRSRSTSPFSAGNRRSYNKDDFGSIKKVDVEPVLARNMASLDATIKNTSTISDKKTSDSVFVQREHQDASNNNNAAGEASSSSLPASKPKVPDKSQTVMRRSSEMSTSQVQQSSRKSKMALQTTVASSVASVQPPTPAPKTTVPTSASPVTSPQTALASCVPPTQPPAPQSAVATVSPVQSPVTPQAAVANSVPPVQTPVAAPRNVRMPPIPPRTNIGSMREKTAPEEPPAQVANTQKLKVESTDAAQVPQSDTNNSPEVPSAMKEEPLYSQIQKPPLSPQSPEPQPSTATQPPPSVGEEGAVSEGSLLRGDSSCSASFPDDVSCLSAGHSDTNPSGVEESLSSISAGLAPQRPAPPPPLKVAGDYYDEVEEFYSLPPEEPEASGEAEVVLRRTTRAQGQDHCDEAEVVLRDTTGAQGEDHQDEATAPQDQQLLEGAKPRVGRQRRVLVQEIITTENEYIHDLEALQQVVRLAPSRPEARDINLDVLMGNIDQVIAVAKQFLKDLDRVGYEEEEGVLVGGVFLAWCERLCEVYKVYCSNYHVTAQPLLDKYEEDPETVGFLQWVLSELQQHKIQLLDMRSVLIKPVQRVLKYPLFLDRLVGETSTSHPDYDGVVKAKAKMAIVAKDINDYTEVLGLVDKYRSESDQSLQSKLQRMSLHSVAKKSARLSTLVSEMLGLMAQTKDPDFDEEVIRFRSVAKAAQTLAHDAGLLLQGVRARHRAELDGTRALARLLSNTTSSSMVEAITRASETSNRLLDKFDSLVQQRVVIPCKKLSGLYEVPERLIQKRSDKLLDYDNAQYKLDRNRDPTRTRILEEELSGVRGTYEALHSQLMAELPVLTSSSLQVVTQCCRSLVAARMYLQGHLAHSYLNMAQVLGLSLGGEDMLAQFRVKYLQQVGELRQLSFLPPDALTRSLPHPKPASRKSLDPATPRPDTAEQGARTKVLGLYPREMVYVVREVHCPVEEMELTLYPGDHVALLKNKDPLGRTDRWFVDDGDNKGFTRAAVLHPLVGQEQRGEAVTALPSAGSGAVTLPAQAQRPTPAPRPATVSRAAPAPPIPERPPRYEDLFPPGQPQEVDQGHSGPHRAPPPRYSSMDLAPRGPDHPHYSQGGAEGKDEKDGGTAETSPIYEVIEDPHFPPDTDPATSDPEEPQFYYALYNFGGADETQLNLVAGQVVLALHAQSSDWWFVEDRHSNQGYVPASYLTKYT